ncbi:Immune-associated nucleotide-binding protein 9 [Bulinus truncatus]|nr:Immune-associated nucleotide-binding protein 9 [Bulinus truncatus]
MTYILHCAQAVDVEKPYYKRYLVTMAESNDIGDVSTFSFPPGLNPESLGVSEDSLKHIQKTFSELKLMRRQETQGADCEVDVDSKSDTSSQPKTNDATFKGKPKFQNDKKPLSSLLKKEISVKSKKRQRTYLNLLLIGKTGNGKSATGNSILGRKVFKSEGCCTSLTSEVDYEVVEYKEHVIKVFDGPGIGDTHYIDDIEKATELVMKKMEDAVLLNPDGYHAFLLVIKYGNRLTAEDKECIRILKAIFGPDFVKNYCILVCTCGDCFAKEHKSGETFEKWCMEQEGIFKELLIECDNRAMLFDNISSEKSVRKSQMKKLIFLVDQIQHGSRKYTAENFQYASRNRQMLVAEIKEPKIRDKAMQTISIIVQKFNSISDLELADQMEQLSQLRDEANDIYGFLVDQAKDTDRLKDLLSNIEHICKMIEIKITETKQREEIALKENEIKERFCAEINKRDEEIKARVLEDEKRKAELMEIEEKLRVKKIQFESEFERREMELKAELEEERRRAQEQIQLKELEFQELLSSQRKDEESLKQTKQAREELDTELAAIYQGLADKENELMETIEKERLDAAKLINEEQLQHDVKLKQLQDEMESLKEQHEEEKEKIAFFFAITVHELMKEVKMIVCKQKVNSEQQLKEINEKYDALKKEHNEALRQAGKKPKFTEEDKKSGKGCKQQ